MLACLVATLAMLQLNLLLGTSGKPPSSLIQNDLMRLPLVILDGIGFIGAGVIIKRGVHVNGVTTGATIWLVTVLGLLFGGGNICLGITASLIAFTILWTLRLVEKYVVREYAARCISPYPPILLFARDCWRQTGKSSIGALSKARPYPPDH